MYRVTKMSSKVYAVKISTNTYDLEEEFEEIQTFAEEGTPVILVEELEDLAELGFNLDDVEIVRRS